MPRFVCLVARLIENCLCGRNKGLAQGKVSIQRKTNRRQR